MLVSRRLPWRTARLPLFVSTILIASLGSYSHSAGAESDYKAKPSVVADRKEDQVQPHVSGDWVVWKDYRNLSTREVDDSPNGEIYGFDLVNKTEVRFGSSNDAGHPAIFDTFVVWTDGRGRSTEIHGADLTTGEVFAITSSSGRQERPAISESTIVWQDNRNGNWDILAFDRDTGAELAVVDHTADQERPAVSGRTVVWEDRRDGGSGPDIRGFDLDEQKAFRVTENHDAYQPAISGRWVVWVGAVDQAVFARNLDEGKTKRLSTARGAKSQPAISGDLVVWTDERNGDRDIYGYDLATGVEFPIAVVDDSDQDDPQIDGTRIVWSDERGPNRDIYTAELTLPGENAETEEPVAAAPSTPTAAPSPAPTSVTASAGIRLRVSGTEGEGLRLRTAPSAAAPVIASLPEDTLLLAMGEPQQHEGRSWYQVRDPDGTTGWVAAEFVVRA